MKELQSIKTEEVKENLIECKSIYDLFNNIIPKVKKQSVEWIREVSNIQTKSELNDTEMANLCGFNNSLWRRWRNGSVPQNRMFVIRIGILAGYDIEEMNRFLYKTARMPELYSKRIEDSICMYVMGKGLKDNVHAVKMFNDIYMQVSSLEYDEETTEGNYVPTRIVDEKIKSIIENEELISFIKENRAIYKTRYYRLCASIKMLIESWYEKDIVGEDGIKKYLATHKSGITASLINSKLGIPRGLKDAIGDIYKLRWVPTRNEVIKLSLMLGLDREQLDELLQDGYMEPLYAKNYAESILIYILKSAEKENVYKGVSKKYSDLLDYIYQSLYTVVEFNDYESQSSMRNADVAYLEELAKYFFSLDEKKYTENDMDILELIEDMKNGDRDGK